MQPTTTDEFKAALGHFASGVTVMTTRVDGEDFGMTASAFSSLSLDPPLVLVCVKKQNHMWEALQRASGFAVSILSLEQQALSNRFAGGTVDAQGNWIPWPDDVSRFDGLTLDRGPVSGSAVLPDALAQLDCSIWQQFDGGDHTIVVGKVECSAALGRGEGSPLVYWSGQYRSVQGDG